MESKPENDRTEPRNRWRIAAWAIAACLLLLPLIAMQFTDEVKWEVGDFVIAGILIGGAGLLYELVVRTTTETAYRAGAGLAIATAFLLIWVNGAVGILGSANNDANLMYAGVIAVGIVGAILARFRSLGMARAMVATAVAQLAVAVIATIGGWGSVGDIVIVNGVFAALFLGSASLFRNSAKAQMQTDAAMDTPTA